MVFQYKLISIFNQLISCWLSFIQVCHKTWNPGKTYNLTIQAKKTGKNL